MNKGIKLLKSTTFAGRRFTRKQLADIQKTVVSFPDLSHREIGHTICEHLNWLTPSGTYKIQTCLNALDEMQTAGLFILPQKVKRAKARQKKPALTDRASEQPEISGNLDQFSSITLQKATQKEEISLWNELVDRYHYLGYRKPIGSHLRYFIIAQTEADEKQVLGCLIFSFPTLNLACRDQWIGWDKAARKQRLNLVLNNNRFLILPWVRIKNLASKVLSMIAKQVADDWMAQHGFRPVLLETFVDPEKYQGTCYKAANWIAIGKTIGHKGSANCPAIHPKEVFVYPLDADFKTTLIQGKQTKARKISKAPLPSTLTIHDPFILLWQRILHIVFQVAEEFDQQWQQRKRLINTMLLILFIFRLVFSKNKQGYGTTIMELWDQCRIMNIPLPQQKPIAPSAFSNARRKLDETIFKTLNSKIIAAYEQDLGEQYWKGHRLFAVDGSKINLPRQLLNKPYKRPSNNAYYPQGLISCLYQLKTRIPHDFELASHYNERTAALSHLKKLHQHDLVTYDRGYFSYAMLYYHVQAGVDAVFRLPQNSFKAIEEFYAGNSNDTIVTLEVSAARQKEILSKYPDIRFIPLQLRLVKYTYDETTYVLGSTLLDSQRYQINELSDLYHSRWGIEELYKISKELIDVGDFHAQSERGVKQELYAHFVLITLNRIFASHAEENINEKQITSTDRLVNTNPLFKVNMKNALLTMARNLEQLFLQQVAQVAQTINNMIDAISSCRQKERPGRKHERVSRKPVKKWGPTKTKSAAGVA